MAPIEYNIEQFLGCLSIVLGSETENAVITYNGQRFQATNLPEREL